MLPLFAFAAMGLCGNRGPPVPAPVAVPSSTPLSASWVATDGYPSENFISFGAREYLNMRNDPGRTDVLTEAIRQRLRGHEGELVVLDIGTGPEALLALIAARAGAKKVYAVEVAPKVADAARQAVEAAHDVEDGVIEIFQGFSTELELPEKADLLVAEIVGNVASAEGIYATMFDAQQRLLREPYNSKSYIPLIVETLAAPMSYVQHQPALSPSDFDWDVVRELAPPPKFCTAATAVQALSEPQALEKLRFDKPLPSPGTMLETSLTFPMCAERMASSAAACEALLAETDDHEVPADIIGDFAAKVGSSMSGIGLWPRLIMDDEDKLKVETRGSDGSPRKSCWELVFPLLCSSPESVAPGDNLRVDATITRRECGRSGDLRPPGMH